MSTNEQSNGNAREQFLAAAVALLYHGTVLERETAVGVIGTLGDDTHIPILIGVLTTDGNRKVQHKTAQSIARIGGDEAITALQRLMREQNPYTRFLAAEALANIVARGI